jgi:KRAB domain-containing zinc finger protein
MKSLNMHYRNIHLSADQAIKHCKRCGQYFRKPVDLSNHEIRVHKIKANREGKDIKGALYTMEYLFAEELADLNFKQNKDFEVPECDKNADGTVSDACKSRYINEMWTDIMFHDCPDCKDSFKSPYLLSLHFNAKHSEDRANFVCKSCPEDKTFLNFESFINHTFTIHHEHLRFFCFICCSGFWDYKALYQHYKTNHEDYNLFMCLYCGRHHKIGYELKHHILTHRKIETEEKKEKRPRNFDCNLCSKAFPKKTQLQRHIETHKKNETKIWICETCGKNFNAKSTLINHAMVHQNDKPYICNVCGEGFKNKYKLNYHKGIHTGEKNFGCEICGQRFRAKGTLKNHMFIHSGERPWSK